MIPKWFVCVCVLALGARTSWDKWTGEGGQANPPRFIYNSAQLEKQQKVTTKTDSVTHSTAMASDIYLRLRSDKTNVSAYDYD